MGQNRTGDGDEEVRNGQNGDMMESKSKLCFYGDVTFQCKSPLSQLESFEGSRAFTAAKKPLCIYPHLTVWLYDSCFRSPNSMCEISIWHIFTVKGLDIELDTEFAKKNVIFFRVYNPIGSVCRLQNREGVSLSSYQWKQVWVGVIMWATWHLFTASYKQMSHTWTTESSVSLPGRNRLIWFGYLRLVQLAVGLEEMCFIWKYIE